VRLDAARNASGDVRITADDATLPVYVIPTDEEGLIARETMAILQPATPGG
jgi:acetate kinase